ncbi:adenylate/guanylate cyclase domain-containing protein [Bradyrhizobium diazoefficiens]|uniref:adenylate/guanylate cyclase domain-containing protein n=1 Tax=Bradyrhizobium diazoefficiens TaxID=1355477 RepID=UPI0038501821
MVQERPVRVERRLSAILAADVAGYSRLMHNDEEATHAKLSALLTEAVQPAIAEHGGHIVKNTGDGFLAEFPSAVEAVRAAMQFQTSIHELTIGDVEDRRIAFRVGINIGDVIVEPHDIFGDGVNIAARLEGVAEPGGICISSSAYDQVQGKVGVEFGDLGEQNLKNIARPVRVYRMRPCNAATRPQASLLHRDTPQIGWFPNMFGGFPIRPVAGASCAARSDGSSDCLAVSSERRRSLLVYASRRAAAVEPSPVDCRAAIHESKQCIRAGILC